MVDVEQSAEIRRTRFVAGFSIKGPQGPPCPTLQQMIDSGARIVVVAEHMTGGASWYRPPEGTIQETPYQFHSPAQMTCRGGQGSRSTNLFLINDWIDTDPAPKPTNAQQVKRRAAASTANRPA